MHPSANYMSIDPEKKTIIPRKPGMENKIGQREKMSAIDIVKLNLMYNCTNFQNFRKILLKHFIL